MGHWARRLSHDRWTFSRVMSGAWWSYSLYFCTTLSATGSPSGNSVGDDGDGPLGAGVRRSSRRGDHVGIVGQDLTPDDGRVALVVPGFEELLFEGPAAPVPLAPPAVDEHLHPGASPEPP